jgi:hypothetical protein
VDGVEVARSETSNGLTITCPYHAIEIAETMSCTTTYNGVNVTSSTSFYSMNTAVVNAGANGYVAPVAVGSTLVWASYNGITVSWDTEVFNLTGSVTAPVSYAYDQRVTWTATPSRAGSWHYTWAQKRCYNGSAPGDCDGLFHTSTSGQDVNTRTSFVHRQDYYVIYAATIRRSAGGPVLANGQYQVSGAGERTTSCSPCARCKVGRKRRLSGDAMPRGGGSAAGHRVHHQ